MFDDLRADDATLAAWHNLADGVRAALMYAGVPVRPSSDSAVGPGAEVAVDDGAGGVYVTWAPSEKLSDAVRRSYLEGRTDGPVNESYFAITLAMRDALMHVLQHAGFRVHPVDDYAMGPPNILVRGSRDAADGAGISAVRETTP